jgi:hypothetical protein
MQTVITCPKTSGALSFDIPADDERLWEYWMQPVVVACPLCGAEHVHGYRDLYIRGVMSAFGCEAVSTVH